MKFNLFSSQQIIPVLHIWGEKTVFANITVI